MMILFFLLVSFNISVAFKFGPKYDVFAKFLNLENTVSKLKRLSPERLLQKKIKSDFEIAVTKSYGDLEIWKKKSSTEFEFFHVSTNNRVLYGQKKHLTTEVEVFFEGKSFDDFDLIGGFDPSLNLVVREKSTNEIQIFKNFAENEEDEEIILKTGFLKNLALINFDEYNVAILPGYQFIAQNKEKNTQLPFIRAHMHNDENIGEMIEECLYIDLMKTEFAKIHSLHRSVQLLKLFVACGAKLPEEQLFRDNLNIYIDYRDACMSHYLETLVALTTNKKLTDKIELLNCETIETENYGNLQISKDKNTQEVEIVNQDTNLKQEPYYKGLFQRLVSRFAPIKQSYKFYGSQDTIEFLYAVNTDTGKVIDALDESNGLVPKIAWYQKVCDKFFKLVFLIGTIFQRSAPLFIFRFVAFIIDKILGAAFLDRLRMFFHKLRMRFYRSRENKWMDKQRKQNIHFLESVNLREYDVIVGVQNGIFLLNKTNKEDIRFFSAYGETYSRKMFKEELKKYFSRSKSLTQQDYINFLKKNPMKPSVQILMMFNQNGMKIDDRICEDFENWSYDASANYVRCLYERILMLKMFQNQRKRRCKISLKSQPKDKIQL